MGSHLEQHSPNYKKQQHSPAIKIPRELHNPNGPGEVIKCLPQITILVYPGCHSLIQLTLEQQGFRGANPSHS